MGNNIINSQLEALNNSLNYFKLNGYTIHKYHQEDKRKVKQLYFLTDSKGTSLTGHWDYAELNSFIRGYGKAVNNHEALLKALQSLVSVLPDADIWEDAEQARQINEATLSANIAIKNAYL